MAPEFKVPEPAATRDPLTVSALNRAVGGLLERSFPLVRVRGEVANFTRASSGHWYFVLKDDQAQVRCVMFRGRNQLVRWPLREGDDVEVTAVVSLYEPRGEFQLSIESMQRAGQGRLFEEFVRLKERLAAEGLFDSEEKRPLPGVPRRVGVVTSLQAAALRDVITCLSRRAPYVEVIVYPAPVQGAGAGQRIAAMLARVSERAEVDVVLLVRGGGSIEDLWAFNEEPVARAIRASTIPVVVGVGHESDITIADFAADLRAATPTAAAELVAPARDELRAELANRLRHMKRCLDHRLERASQRLDYAQRSLATPRAPLMAIDARIGALYARIRAAAEQSLARRRGTLARQREVMLRLRLTTGRAAPSERVARAAAEVRRCWNAAATRLAFLEGRLKALDPAAVLERGYAIVLAGDGSVVTDSRRLHVADALRVQFARGGAEVRVHALLPEASAGEADG